ncbi:MAG TPA: 2-dehydropantoate 2-reductase [Candidatus Polarisedimenticolaceae bacterium]|nr:2-dehydropantoate 2-reductase [Candidatus Polarisedimenticolaceae bacterium]
MRVAFVGAGGVGGLFGAQLARGGEEVIFIARGGHLDAIREDGLTVHADTEVWNVRPALATDDPREVGAVDAVVLAVKTFQLEEAARQIGPMLREDTVVLPLQNGVEATGQLAALLGEQRVLVGLCGTLSWIAGPGRIRSLGTTHFVRLGEPDGRKSARVEALHRAFVKSGVRAEVPDDVHAALWEKFLFVVPMGGVGAVTRAPIGVTRALPETRALLRDAMQEIADLARASEVRLREDIVSRALQFMDGLDPAGTSSLQRDLAAGRPSELEAWNGAVVRLGQARGVPTPTHAFLHASLLPQERAARPRRAQDAPSL